MVITTGCLQYLLIMNIMLVVLANAIGQEKPFRVNKNWKRSKTLFADYIILYLRNTRWTMIKSKR